MATRKAELERELLAIEREEIKKRDEEERKANWQRFLDRPSDWLIGKAHAEQIKDNGWRKPKGQLLPISVSIHGNTGKTYYPVAQLVDASYTYFHNVWSEGDRRSFQEKLNALVQAEVERISKSLSCILEILGLQSNNYWLEKLPKDKVGEAKRMIWEETVAVLDAYPDDSFVKLGNISHGKSILARYLSECRPHLLNKEQK